MNQGLIDNWNSVVTNEDTTMICGDFCWTKEERWIEILEQLNGHKQLVLGNHCLKHMSKNLKRHFQDIEEYKEITDNGHHIILSHYPIMAYKGAYDEKTWMVHGHTHLTREQRFVEQWTQKLVESRSERGDSWGHVINCGVMMPWMDWSPQPLEVLIAAWESKYNTK